MWAAIPPAGQRHGLPVPVAKQAVERGAIIAADPGDDQRADLTPGLDARSVQPARDRLRRPADDHAHFADRQPELINELQRDLIAFRPC